MTLEEFLKQAAYQMVARDLQEWHVQNVQVVTYPPNPKLNYVEFMLNNEDYSYAQRIQVFTWEPEGTVEELKTQIIELRNELHGVQKELDKLGRAGVQKELDKPGGARE